MAKQSLVFWCRRAFCARGIPALCFVGWSSCVCACVDSKETPEAAVTAGDAVRQLKQCVSCIATMKHRICRSEASKQETKDNSEKRILFHFAEEPRPSALKCFRQVAVIRLRVSRRVLGTPFEWTGSEVQEPHLSSHKTLPLVGVLCQTKNAVLRWHLVVERLCCGQLLFYGCAHCMATKCECASVL